jgi:hypothetical protein
MIISIIDGGVCGGELTINPSLTSFPHPSNRPKLNIPTPPRTRIPLKSSRRLQQRNVISIHIHHAPPSRTEASFRTRTRITRRTRARTRIRECRTLNLTDRPPRGQRPLSEVRADEAERAGGDGGGGCVLLLLLLLLLKRTKRSGACRAVEIGNWDSQIVRRLVARARMSREL